MPTTTTSTTSNLTTSPSSSSSTSTSSSTSNSNSNSKKSELPNINTKKEKEIVVEKDESHSVTSQEDDDDDDDSSSDDGNISSGDEGNWSDNDENSKYNRFRRTDSIAKYRAKKVVQDLERMNNENPSSATTSTSPLPSPSSSPNISHNNNNIKINSSPNINNNRNTSTTTNTSNVLSQSQIVTPPNQQQQQQELQKRPVPSIVIPPTTLQEENRKKRLSIDSDDSEFGYDDDLQFITVVKRSPRSETLKPITNPIPKRPIFQVDPAQETINISLIALRTSLRIGYDKIDSITQNEFQYIKKYTVSIGDKKCIIKDYSPNVFHNLRNRLGVDSTDFLKSWSAFIQNDQKKSSVKNESQFTIYSSDKKYIMNTLSKSDSVKLRKLLPHYYNYMVYNPNSFLVKYLGLFRLGHRSKQSCYVFLSSQEITDYTFLIGFQNTKALPPIEENILSSPSATSLISSVTPPPPLSPTSSGIPGMSHGGGSGFFPNFHSPPTSVSAPPNMAFSLNSNTSLSSSASTITPPSTPVSFSESDFGSPRFPIIDPIKTVPRLLYFIEEIENVTKSNNIKISKSLKKSFNTLPRSWSLEDMISLDDNAPIILNNLNYPSSGKPNLTVSTTTSTHSSAPPSPVLTHSAPSVRSNNHHQNNNLLLNINNNNQNNNNSPILLVTPSSNGNTNSSTNNNPLSQSTSNYLSQVKYRGGFLSDNLNNNSSSGPQEIYFIGVVDFLSKLDNKKKIANIAKSYTQSIGIGGTPNMYLKRFLGNVRDILNQSGEQI
eukprot:gene2188-2691_t